jgi:hypothetical protein
MSVPWRPGRGGGTSGRKARKGNSGGTTADGKVDQSRSCGAVTLPLETGAAGGMPEQPGPSQGTRPSEGLRSRQGHGTGCGFDGVCGFCCASGIGCDVEPDESCSEVT